MNKRTYNPLTEGYSGQNISKTAYRSIVKEIHGGYTGHSTASSAPKTIPAIKSAVMKSNQSNQS